MQGVWRAIDTAGGSSSVGDDKMIPCFEALEAGRGFIQDKVLNL